jgi:hypothetical protein
MKKYYLTLALLCVFLLAMTSVRSEVFVDKKVFVGAFSLGSLVGWQPQIFEGKTQYQLVKDEEEEDKQVLMSYSEATASGLVYKQRIDLEQTPWLNWSWKTYTVLTGLDERLHKGDDFTARLYVIIDGGLLFWKTQALNYVWASSHGKGEIWENPYTSHTTMIAIDAGSAGLGSWQYYSRNVREDFKHILGKDVRYIDAVAIMTDTDNSQQKATTYYGDIFFTDKKQVSETERDDEIK